jgi:hypothetical protein
MSQPPPSSSGPQASTAPPPPIDDMHDTPADLARWPQLAGNLQVCADAIEPAFRKADAAALRHQWYHRQLVKWATVFGTAAILFAILQLAFGEAIGLHQIAFDELAAVVIALIAFVLGSLVAFQIRWLVERNKAERLRMAKFQHLIDPELWNGDPATQQKKRAKLEGAVKAIEAARHNEVHQWIENDAVPTPPDSILGLSTPPPVTGELLDYYHTRRLDYQLDFFRKRANEYLRFQKATMHVSVVLFLVSVGAVLVHYGHDLLTHAEQLDTLSRWMIVLAASLPVLGGTFRTFREAYQFARNTYRYRAKAVALASIKAALEQETTPRSQFLGLWFCEQTLENEHREWLRLMLEAEWFG